MANDTCTSILTYCDSCAERTGATGVAISFNEVDIAAMNNIAFADAVPSILDDLGVSVWSDNPSHTNGTQYRFNMPMRSANAKNATPLQSRYACSYRKIVGKQGIPVSTIKHANYLTGRAEICRNEMVNQTFYYSDGTSETIIAAPTDAQIRKQLTAIVESDYKEQKKGLLWGDIKGGTGSVDGLMNHIKAATKNTGGNQTIQYTLPATGGVTYHNAGLPLFFATAVELRDFLATVPSDYSPGDLAYTVQLVGNVLYVASNRIDDEAADDFILYTGDVTTGNLICTAVAIDGVIIKDANPFAATPYVLSHTGVMPSNIEKTIIDFVIAAIQRGQSIGLNYTAQTPLIVLHDPHWATISLLKDALQRCCDSTDSSIGLVASAVNNNGIILVPFAPFNNTGLLLGVPRAMGDDATIEFLSYGFDESTTVPNMINFGYDDSCSKHSATYIMYMGWFIKYPQNIIFNGDGYAQYDRLTGDLLERECSVGYALLRHANGISTEGSAFQTSGMMDTYNCDELATQKVKVTDTTNYATLPHTGTQIDLSYNAGGLTVTVPTITTAAGVLSHLFELPLDATNVSAVIKGLDGTNTFVGALVTPTAPKGCAQFTKVCVTRTIVAPANGTTPAEIDAVVASYAAFEAVDALFVDATATEARYTLYLLQNALPTAVAGDTIVAGACA